MYAKTLSYRQLLETSQDMLLVCNPQYKVVYATPTYSSMVSFCSGMPMEEDLALHLQLLHPDDRPTLRRLHSDLVANDFYLEHQKRIITAKGATRWMLIQSFPLHGAEGVLTHICFRVQDVTENKRLQVLLNDTQRLAKGGGWSLNFITEEVYWTEEIYRMHEVPHDYEPTREKLFEFYPAQYRQQLQAAMEAIVSEQQPFDLELQLYTARGTPLWVRTLGAPVVRDGQVYKMTGVLQDITSRKLAEEKNSQLVQALELAADGFSIADQTGKWNYSNKAQHKLLGYAHGELLGAQWNSIYTPQEAERLVQEAWPKLVQQGRWYGEVVATRKDGTTAPMLLSLSMLEDGNIISSMRDDSLRKQAEQEIILARNRAEEASRMKTQFLSTVSHEIRTPLNAVIGITQLMREQASMPHQQENLEALYFSAQNLLGLINDVLDYNKIEAGKLELSLQEFSLGSLLDGISQSFLYQTKAKGITLQFEAVSDEVRYRGDLQRITQVLMNLVSNAVKFTAQGGITVQVTHSNTPTKDHCVLNFKIIDTGIGIPQDRLPFLFEPFVQADAATARLYGGSGLGLTIAKTLSELMGGTLTVQSEPGKGSTFCLSLPLQQVAITYLSPESIDTNSLADAYLLVVEDNATNRFVLGQFLTKWKVRHDFAENGQQACAMITSQAYDAVLMDLQMPVMDGYKATEAIRNMQGSYYAQVPIVALSASALADFQQKAYAHGMTDFLTKPFNPKELQEKIYASLAHKGRSNTFMDESNAVVAEKVNITLLMAQHDQDEALVRSLAEVFLSDATQLLEQLHTALTLKDWQALQQAAHTLKSTTGFLQLQTTTSYTQQLEHQLKQGQTTGAAWLVQQLTASCKAGMLQLEQHFNLSSD